MNESLRYRRSDWRRVKKTLPPDVLRACGVQDAPPGYVKISFGSDDARDHLDRLIGPPVRVEDFPDRLPNYKERQQP